MEFVDEIAFILSLLICFVFYIAYRRFSAEMEREELLNHFLND